MNKTLPTLLIFGLAYPMIVFSELVKSNERIQQKPLFSVAIDEAIDKLDPIAFEKGLQEFGPYSKHMRGLIAVILKNKSDALTNKHLGDVLEGLRNHNTPKENFILLSSSFSLSGAAFLSLLNYLEKDSNSSRFLSSPLTMGAGIAMALYALWGIRWCVKNDRKKEQEKAEKEERAKQEYNKKIEAILQMLEVLKDHPLKENS